MLKGVDLDDLYTSTKNTLERSLPPRTLNILKALSFLGAHKETVRHLAARGEVAAVKVGRSWRFIEQDLVTYIRSKYSRSDASQGVTARRNNQRHSSKEVRFGGSISATKEIEYEKLLGLQ